MSRIHIQDELLQSAERVVVHTAYGSITGGRAANGAAVFLEIPYALPPTRFEDPVALPSDFVYEKKEYIYEAHYAAQPMNDGQAAGVPHEDKVGLGKPSENPLFLNVVCPPSFPSHTGSPPFPVKVYIHGGFLQFGSPHGLGSQSQYVSAERSEIWVNIGYRLSAFGFLACDQPKVDGNFGFKDQWLALKWIKDNIKVFGGDSNNIQITGLSAGAHSVHQLLHHASHLPDGEDAPFHSAIMQSNAIVTTPKTPSELKPQFDALCHALNLDPNQEDILSTLRDPSLIPWSQITHVIETDALGIENGTFRGTLDDSWLPSSLDPMEWQRTGGLGRALKAKGVRSVVVGDLTEEWYLYSIAHPVRSMGTIEHNMDRYYRKEIVTKMMDMFPNVPVGAPEEEFQRLFGEMLSQGQVYLPVRLLARDLLAAGFPVLRYEIAWTPEQNRPRGYVTHASDRAIWAFRLPDLKPSQVEVARAWLDTVAAAVEVLETRGKSDKGLLEVLALKTDKDIGWVADGRWDEIMRLRTTLPGEI